VSLDALHAEQASVSKSSTVCLSSTKYA
jgi:hypothetical protein